PGRPATHSGAPLRRTRAADRRPRWPTAWPRRGRSPRSPGRPAGRRRGPPSGGACCLPSRGRSGSGRYRPPKNRADAGAVDGALRPVQLAGSVESFEQDGVDLLPGAVGLPVPQPAPARHPAPAVHLRWQVLPRPAGPEHEQDAGQGLPVRERRPAALRAQRGQRREQGLDDLPQGVGQQRLGHPWRPPIGGRQFARKSAAGQVKLGFLSMLGRISVGMPLFDLVIVDEAAKASLPECLIAAMCAKRLVLVGDHHQLLPFLDERMLERAGPDQASRNEVEALWNNSLFRRLWDRAPDNCKVFLSRQFRSRPAIARAVSTLFYAGRVENEKPNDSELVPSECSLVWVDTKGRHSDQIYRDGSIYNPREAGVVMGVLTMLADCLPHPDRT